MIDTVDMKQTERLFLAIRLGAIPILLVLGWLHDPLPMAVAASIAGVLVAASAVAWHVNRRARGLRVQQALGGSMMALDALAAGTAIALFLADRSTAAFAGFSLVVIEAGVRYGLVGGVGMAVAFAIGLASAMAVRLAVYEVSFSLSGYLFWTLFIALLGVTVGLLVRQNRRRQEEVRKLSGQQARLEERHRVSRELHDSLLKTLHGLSFEAHVLATEDEPARGTVWEKARYIEGVCGKAAKDIRDLIFDLRREEERPFRDQASQIVDGWRLRTGVVVQLSWGGEDVMLPSRLDHDLRQALGEALLNIERHANASEVSVIVDSRPSKFTIEVTNDGVDGSPARVSTTGIGLVSMKERLEQWGGYFSFSFDSGCNSARLRLSVPRPFTVFAASA